MNYNAFGKVYENQDLYNYNTYKVHSICDYLIIVNNIVKLINLIKYLNDNNIKYFIIGNGSNIILPSKYDGVVIKLDLNDIEFNRNLVTASAGVLLPLLVQKCLDKNLVGLEFLSGIPGTIGGSVIGNAGAYGDQIGKYISEVEVLENNKVRILKGSELKFEYRSSNLKNRNLILLRATFKLKKGDSSICKETIKENLQKRKNSQPLECPSAGCVFRNPNNMSAGKLIDDLNLKGYKINDALISNKHANFIVNNGNATGEDIVKLIDYIKDKVKEKYEIDLVLEQIIIN